MYKWTEAINQAASMIKNGTDPLTIVYSSHDIRKNYFKFSSHLLKADNQLLLNETNLQVAKSTLNMRMVSDDPDNAEIEGEQKFSGLTFLTT